MVAKSCGTCEHWKPATNNFSQENRSMGAWGECSLFPMNEPKDGVFALVQIRAGKLSDVAYLRTRVEFYCGHYETLSKEAKT